MADMKFLNTLEEVLLERGFPLDIVQKVLETAQTIDAVEVVRCKDCLYSTERDGHLCCIHGVSYRNSWNKPDFFCYRGERRDGDSNG